MIDPLECVIRWLQQDAALVALVGDRIAAKHRYPERVDVSGWSRDDAGLMVRLDGGIPSLYVAIQPIRLEIRCYASSQYLASRAWQRLVELSRETERQAVLTSTGSALLYWFHQSSGPSMLHDGQINLDFIMSFWDALVAEQEIA